MLRDFKKNDVTYQKFSFKKRRSSMAERYEKLREIGRNMWVSDCPVMLYKGVLLHDNKLNKNLLQLGFEAISNKCIAGVEIAYQGFSLGEELIVEGEYSYLDLNLQINEMTGDKSPIYLDDNNARDFHITVKRIFFSDRTTWESNRELHELEEQKELKGNLGDVYGEFKHLYHHHELGNNLFIPVYKDNYWQCVCGTLNRKEGACRRCNISRDELGSLLNINMLRQKKLEREREQERLAEEEKERNRKKAEKKKIAVKRLHKCFILLVFGGIFTALAMLGVNKFVLPSMDYQSAISKLKERNYDDGLAILQELSNYKDSAKLMKKYALNAVTDYTEEGKYVEAFSIADKYHVTDKKAIYYLKGLSSIENKQYPLAFDYLKRCKGYKMADKKIQLLNYTLGCEEMRNGNLNEAYAYFNEIDSAYQDTARRQATCKKFMKYCKKWTTMDSHSTNFSFEFKIKIADNEEPKMYYVFFNIEERIPLPKNNKVSWAHGRQSFDFSKGIYRETTIINGEITHQCKMEN